MRYNEFSEYVNKHPKNWDKGYKGFLLRSIEMISGCESLDVDKPQDLSKLINIYTYTREDDDNNKANPTALTFSNPDKLKRDIGIKKTALLIYQAFSSNPTDILESIKEEKLTEEESDTGLLCSYETDLQNALRDNINQLEEGLVIIDDGRERQVASGRIDILARDKDGKIVVIELKRDKSPKGTIEQIMGYMGDICAEENVTDVRGIIVASEFTQREISGSIMAPTLELKEYGYTFCFNKPTGK